MESTPGFSKNDLAQCTNWLLPDVSSAPLIVPSAQKQAQRRESLKQPAHTSTPSTVTDTPTSPSPTISSTTQSDADTGAHESVPNESIDTLEKNIEPLTAEKLEEITQAAEKEGFANGYEKGLEQGAQQGLERGLAEAKERVNNQCKYLQHIIDALFIPLDNEHNRLENIVVDMICQLTRGVVQRELNTQPSDITQLVDKALAMLPMVTTRFTLYLNSDDLDLVDSHLQLLEQAYQLRVDDELLPGGCRLESQHSRIDASIEARLEEILDDFIHKRLPEKTQVKNSEPPEDSAEKNTTSQGDNEDVP